MGLYFCENCNYESADIRGFHQVMLADGKAIICQKCFDKMPQKEDAKQD